MKANHAVLVFGWLGHGDYSRSRINHGVECQMLPRHDGRFADKGPFKQEKFKSSEAKESVETGISKVILLILCY